MTKEKEERYSLFKILENSPIMKCPNRGVHLEMAHERKNYKGELQDIQNSLLKYEKEGTQDYQNKLNLLKRLSYVDSHNCLLIKGIY